MIYQPRKHGVFVYQRSFPVIIKLETGIVIKRAVKVLVQVRNCHKFAIVAGWDNSVEPVFKRIPFGFQVEHRYRGGKLNVN